MTVDGQMIASILQAIGINADWSEKNQKFQVQNAKKRNEQRMRNEIENTYEEIKMRRRVRLRELYIIEMEMYEKELAEKGLSIVKER
jgi:transcription initiation factor TFIIIB Brf1 subunit/transcription initiation factor TFIIB